MIKVLLTDDHVIVRDGIKTLLKKEEDISVVAEANNGQEALEILGEQEIDVILLDINMPVLDGLETSEIIKEKYPRSKMIALTMYREMNMVESMFKNGAKAYLLKSCSREELTGAIKGVAEGHEYLDETLRTDFESYMNKPLRKGEHSAPSVSKREKEVLQLISEEMTTSEIAGKLFISITTVETHRKNMLKKLGVRNTAGLMRYAFEHGLID